MGFHTFDLPFIFRKEEPSYGSRGHRNGCPARCVHPPVAQVSDFLIRAQCIVILGVAKIIDGVQEGFHNAPTWYGSEPREVRITDWKSGLAAGGKVMFMPWVLAVASPQS